MGPADSPHAKHSKNLAFRGFLVKLPTTSPPQGPMHASPEKNEPRQFQDARALPAPPAALWTFAVIFTVSVVWALVHA